VVAVLAPVLALPVPAQLVRVEDADVQQARGGVDREDEAAAAVGREDGVEAVGDDVRGGHGAVEYEVHERVRLEPENAPDDAAVRVGQVAAVQNLSGGGES
jgi:hypothetical protein